LKKTIKPIKHPTLYFSFEKMYYEVKNKISSILVQLTVHFFNETKQTATKFERFDETRRIIRTV